MRISLKVEHHNLDESNGLYFQESREEQMEPTNVEFNDDILSMEYEAFLCEFDVNVGLDVDLCVEYESFSFDPIITGLLFESHKSEFVESRNIVTENFNLDQALAHFDIGT